MWFYVADGTQHGPVAFEQLLANLQRAADPRAIHVWRDGMPGWQLVASVPEVAARLFPPPMPVAEVGQDGEEPVAVAVAGALLYRRLVVMVGAQMLMGLALRVTALGAPPVVAALLAIAGLLASFGFWMVMAVTIYRLTSLLEEGVPVLWAIALFVPFVNIVALLVISQKAQAWCRKRGIYVGLLGPDKASIEWLRSS